MKISTGTYVICHGVLLPAIFTIFDKNNQFPVKITFLGTGTSQGVPIIACNCKVCTSENSRDKRLRSSLLIQDEGVTVVIDAGPDFRQQMLRAKVQNLDGLLLTHGHKDHIGGMDDLRAFNWILKRPIDVYLKADVQADVEREFSYAFTEEKYPGVPELELHQIDNKPFFVKSLEFTPIHVMHFKLPILGFRYKNFAYITDGSYISPKEKLKITGLDTLVINGLRKEPHYSHFNLAQALDVIKEANPKHAFITHISHALGLHNEIENELPERVHLAYDGLQI